MSAQRSVPSDEIRVEKGSLVGTFLDPVEFPHIELATKRSVLGLAKEEREDFHDSVRIVNNEAAAVENPRND